MVRPGPLIPHTPRTVPQFMIYDYQFYLRVFQKKKKTSFTHLSQYMPNHRIEDTYNAYYTSKRYSHAS